MEKQNLHFLRINDNEQTKSSTYYFKNNLNTVLNQ